MSRIYVSEQRKIKKWETHYDEKDYVYLHRDGIIFGYGWQNDYAYKSANRVWYANETSRYQYARR